MHLCTHRQDEAGTGIQFQTHSLVTPSSPGWGPPTTPDSPLASLPGIKPCKGESHSSLKTWGHLYLFLRWIPIWDHLCGFYSLLLRLSLLTGERRESGLLGQIACSSDLEVLPLLGAMLETSGIKGLVCCLSEQACARQGSWAPHLVSILHCHVSHVLQSVYTGRPSWFLTLCQGPSSSGIRYSFTCFSTAARHAGLCKGRGDCIVCIAHIPRHSFHSGGKMVGGGGPFTTTSALTAVG